MNTLEDIEYERTPKGPLDALKDIGRTMTDHDTSRYLGGIGLQGLGLVGSAEILIRDQSARGLIVNICLIGVGRYMASRPFSPETE